MITIHLHRRGEAAEGYLGPSWAWLSGGGGWQELGGGGLSWQAAHWGNSKEERLLLTRQPMKYYIWNLSCVSLHSFKLCPFSTTGPEACFLSPPFPANLDHFLLGTPPILGLTSLETG